MIAEFLLEQSKNILICIALFLGVKCELKYHEMLDEREVLYKVLTDFEKNKIQQKVEEETDGQDI